MSDAPGLSLRSRFVIGSALIVALPVIAAVAGAWILGNRLVDSTTASTLARSKAVQAHFSSWRAHQLELISRVVSTDPAFVSYVSEAMPALGATLEPALSLSLADLLAERQQELGLDSAIALDPEGRVVARTDRAGGTGEDLARDPLVARALVEMRPVNGFRHVGSRLQQAAIVPIARGPDLIGFLLTGLAVDDALASEMARIGGTGVLLLDVSATGATEVAATSLDLAATDAVKRSLALRPSLVQALLRDGRAIESLVIEESGSRTAARLDPILDASGHALGAVASLASSDATAAAFRRVRDLTLGAGLAALVLGLVLAMLLARRTLAPVREIAAAAQAAAGGDFSRSLVVPREPELGAMARAFNTLLRDLRERTEMDKWTSDLSRRLPEGHGLSTPTRPGSLVTGTATGVQVNSRSSGHPSRERPLDVGVEVDGRYEILGLLGEGGMGVVYAARDRELSEVVALKVLHRSASRDPEQLDKMKAELRLARRITHPNVLRTHDYGEHEGLPYISMELVNGLTLRDVLEDVDRMSEAPARRIARQICDGLAAAHAVGVLHRDIKPENIILDRAGHARIADFGIAMALGRQGRDVPESTSRAGTPPYLAPEGFDGEAASQRSDIYSMGVVIHELFTGKLPFEWNTRDELVAQKRGAPARPSAVRADVPKGLDELVMRCLDPDPARRYADMSSLLRDLDGIGT